ncbi:MAG TPA: radical SAM/SPASM domain-containing protein [Paludibacter sp.]|nr:radical SAM/SPASM domain-containing protein [Paludibacter sp.]
MLKMLINIQQICIFFRYLSFKKTVNFLKLLLSWLLSRSGRVLILHKPSFISVEPASYCNLKCPECPVGKAGPTSGNKKNIDPNLFRNLVDELKTTLLEVILYFQGEPFLNKDLAEMIRYAHDAKIHTTVSTNGQFINKNNARSIVSSGLDKLIVSIDGATQDVYEQYRVGGNLGKALDAVRQVVHWKKELHSATPIVEIQCIVLKTNEHQLAVMEQLAKDLQADRLKLKTAMLENFELGNRLMPTSDKFSRYKKDSSGKYRLKNRQPNHCWRLWSGAVVTASGEVLPCCFDKMSEHSFGNMKNSSFADCWQGKEATSFQKKILENRKGVDICRNCTSRL